MDIDSLRVRSVFETELFNCSDLENYTGQLAVLFYPQESFNERFLINVRNCMIKLADDHPVKRWLEFVSSQAKPTAKEQEQLDFTAEILNSPFNLITEHKIKSRVIDLLTEIPEGTISERLLRSYMYLMIGNITRSDLILKEIINTSPRKNYIRKESSDGRFKNLAIQNLDKIFSKLSKHPADRSTFELFCLYLRSYMNSPELLSLIQSIDTSRVEGRLELRNVERMAPLLVKLLNLQSISKEKRLMTLAEGKIIPISAQSNWVWPFIAEAPTPSDTVVEELLALEVSDPIWAIYLLDDERLSDIYLKRGGRFSVANKRSFLRSKLQGEDFMLAVYKLIELGDIDKDLIDKTLNHLTQ